MGCDLPEGKITSRVIAQLFSVRCRNSQHTLLIAMFFKCYIQYMIRTFSIFESVDIKSGLITTAYDRPYSEKDWNRWPSLSFPLLSTFNYAAANQNLLLTSSDILFERHDLEFEIAKLPIFTGDQTLTIQFMDMEAEPMNDFTKSGSAAGIKGRTPQIDHIINRLIMKNSCELFREQCLLDLLNAVSLQGKEAVGRTKINSHSFRLVDKAKEYIFSNFNKKIQIKDIAASAYLSPFHFCRIFKRITGYSTYNYLQMIRIEQARQFLIQGETVTSSALKSGFQSLEHFSHAFSTYERMPPSFVKRKFLPVK